MALSHSTNWQSWGELPPKVLPVAIIGAGSVVKVAHLPTYLKLGIPIVGIFDIDPKARNHLQKEFNSQLRVFQTLEELIETVRDIHKGNVIFDMAVPPQHFASTLKKLPNHSKVLMQKPMGKTLEEAMEIVDICQTKNMIAAVNHQHRFSPNMLFLHHAIHDNPSIIGTLTDITVTVNTYLPWDTWPWLANEERMEVLFHSVHYIDTIRALVGPDIEVSHVYCKATKCPQFDKYQDTRTSVILHFDKAPQLRCSITTNHCFEGLPNQCVSQLRIDGSKGAAIATIGSNLNYPMGEKDTLLLAKDRKTWEEINLRGSWFIEAFEGPITNFQRFVAGSDSQLVTSVQNTLKTMQIVEACYNSSLYGETRLPPIHLQLHGPSLQSDLGAMNGKQNRKCELQIVDLEVKDIRFPTSQSSDGSDAMHTNPDYSAAYVTLYTNDNSLKGNGLTFTLGRGNEVCLAAVNALKPLIVGRTLHSITSDFGTYWRTLTSEPQLRWLGPEKGVIHLATAAILNAIWDLWAKSERKPLWKLLCDLSPKQLISCLDFRYITDVLTEEEALEILNQNLSTKQEREEYICKEGYPAYTTSVGWLGYSDDKIKRLCREALAQGWTHFKMKVGANLEDDIRRAKIIRQEIGPNKLSMDANQRWSVDEAISNMKVLSQFNPYWIEEPTSPDDILGHAAIAAAIHPIPVATGEQCQNRVMFKQFLQAKGLQICQIDSCRLGSVNEIITVLLMAKKFGVPVCPHAGGVGLCEYVQHLAVFDYIAVSATLENRVIEYVDHLHEHFEHPVVIRNACYTVPTAPGYSIDMKRDSLKKFEFPNGSVWRSWTF